MAQLVKVVDGLAIASCKVVDGLAIASVKTIMGLDNTSGGGGTTPPTFVSETEVASWMVTTTPRALAAQAVTSGNMLVAMAAVEGNSTIITIADTAGNSWGTPIEVNVASNCHVYIWKAVANSTVSTTLTFTDNSGSLKWGGTLLQWSGSAGFGASSTGPTGSGAPLLSLTTTGNNSAVVCISADWNAVDGGTRTWRTVNSITPTSGNGLEKTYQTDPSAYTVYAAVWNDAGAAGANNYGLSAPGGQQFAIAALEIKGT